jgi:hypothetical protein
MTSRTRWANTADQPAKRWRILNAAEWTLREEIECRHPQKITTSTESGTPGKSGAGHTLHEDHRFLPPVELFPAWQRDVQVHLGPWQRLLYPG